MVGGLGSILAMVVWAQLLPGGLPIGGTYEALMGLLEERADTPVVGAIDLDRVASFELDGLGPGLHLLYSGRVHSAKVVDGASEVVVLIHGLNESGAGWDGPVRELVARPGLIVFFFVWTAWNRMASVKYWIGHDLSALARAFSGKVERLLAVGHSGGGVLLLEALCRRQASRHCAFDPRAAWGLTLTFHAVASPFRGYGWETSDLAIPFAGPVTAYLGSEIVYRDALTDLDLHVWITSYERDHTLQARPGRDMRFPVFEGPAPRVHIHHLPDSSHIGAISDALEKIID